MKRIWKLVLMLTLASGCSMQAPITATRCECSCPELASQVRTCSAEIKGPQQSTGLLTAGAATLGYFLSGIVGQ